MYYYYLTKGSDVDVADGRGLLHNRISVYCVAAAATAVAATT